MQGAEVTIVNGGSEYLNSQDNLFPVGYVPESATNLETKVIRLGVDGVKYRSIVQIPNSATFAGLRFYRDFPFSGNTFTVGEVIKFPDRFTSCYAIASP